MRKCCTVFNLVGLSFPRAILATPYLHLSYIPSPFCPSSLLHIQINSHPPIEGADLTPLSASLLPLLTLHFFPKQSFYHCKTPLTGNHVDKQQFLRCHASETINRCHLMTSKRALLMLPDETITFFEPRDISVQNPKENHTSNNGCAFRIQRGASPAFSIGQRQLGRS